MRLNRLPESGEVLVGNPSDEARVEALASDCRLDYFLSSYVWSGTAIVVTCVADLRGRWWPAAAFIRRAQPGWVWIEREQAEGLIATLTRALEAHSDG